MINHDIYVRWAESYAVRFGFGPEDARMLASWFDVLGNYDLPDLDAATGLLARREYPSWPRDHLKALLAVLREVVAARLTAAADADRRRSGPDRGTCTLCRGTGRVTVPHPRAVSGGRWVPLHIARGGASWYTAAVLCRCPLGSWYAQHGGMARKDGVQLAQLTLDAYERICPGWRDELHHRAAEDRAVAAERNPPIDFAHGLNRERLDRLLAGLTHSVDALPSSEDAPCGANDDEFGF